MKYISYILKKKALNTKIIKFLEIALLENISFKKELSMLFTELKTNDNFELEMKIKGKINLDFQRKWIQITQESIIKNYYYYLTNAINMLSI